MRRKDLPEIVPQSEVDKRRSQVAKKRGRTYYLTDDQIIQVEALAATLNLGQIADYFGIGVSRFNEMRKENPEIERRYYMGKSRAIESVAQTLLDKAKGGNVAAMMFYLKTQAGWKDIRRVEQTGADGSPIQVENKKLSVNIDLSNLSDEELELARKIGLKDDGDLIE